MKAPGNFLPAAGSVFFIESAFETYLLTPMRGRQMLFFSLAHIAPGFFWVVALPGLAFAALAVFAFVVVLLSLVRKSGAGGS